MNAPTQQKTQARAVATIATWESFQTELQAREQAIASMLPKHVSRERFIASAVAAVKQTPDLLLCTQRSLFASVTKSAQDGLLPDGREGVITVYNEKQRDNTWAKVAQWNPMTFGLRKRARELDEIIVNAQVVYSADVFSWLEGDNPQIDHQPALLGSGRGAMIGAYAIFRRGDVILHREVMDADQINRVRGQSKSAEGLMWKTFTEEAWRKTVVRRGFKSVPCSEKLETIIHRDDDQFAFDETVASAPSLTPPSPPKQVAKPATAVIESGKGGQDNVVVPEEATVVEAGEAVKAEAVKVDDGPGPADPEKFRKWVDKILATVTEESGGIDGLQTIFNAKIDPHMKSLFPPDQDDILAIYEKHERRLGGD